MSEPRVTEQDRETHAEMACLCYWQQIELLGWAHSILNAESHEDGAAGLLVPGERLADWPRKAAMALRAERAARQAAEQERDEARRSARDHHLLGGCITCMANESEKIAAEQRAERWKREAMARRNVDWHETSIARAANEAAEREDAARGEQS